MVTLSKIYTRTGDDGSTGLADFSRTTKTDPRLVAYADTDEANSVLGVARAAGLPSDLDAIAGRVQNDLFDVGADLATPLRSSYEHPPLRVKQEWIDELEADCDTCNDGLATLRSFILPGGTLSAAHLHVARTVVRRAERAAWQAIASYGTEPAAPEAERGSGGVNPLTATYLNRLSDLLFIMARAANAADAEQGGDVLWQPGGGRE